MQVQHLVHSLVYSLADSCWLAAVLWLCYRLVSWLIPMQPVHAYRLAGIFVAVLFIGWVTLGTLHLLGGASLRVQFAHNYFSSGRFENSPWWMFAIAGMYLMGLCFQMIRFLKGRHQLQLMAMGYQPLPEHWQSILEQQKWWKNTTHSIRVVLSNKVSSPLTFGWIKPLILFPLASVNYLDINEFKSILLHELAHVRRKDYLYQIIFDWMEILLFFNPFARDLFRTIRIEREKCCDDEVMQSGIAPLHYFSALHWCARNGFALSGTLGAINKEMELLDRMRRISQSGYKKEKTAPSLFWSALATILIATQLPALLVPNTTMVGKEMAAVEQMKPIVRTTFHIPLASVASSQRKKKTDKSIKNPQVNSGKKIEPPGQEILATDLTDPSLLQAVNRQEKDEVTSLIRAINQIRHPTKMEVAKLFLEVMHELSREEKIAWLQLMKKRRMQPLTEATAPDPSFSALPDDVLSLQEEEYRLEAKIMLLIRIKWKEKNPGLAKDFIDRSAFDSTLSPLVSEQ